MSRLFELKEWLMLTRIGGHFTIEVKGVRNGKDKSTVRGRVYGGIMDTSAFGIYLVQILSADMLRRCETCACFAVSELLGFVVPGRITRLFGLLCSAGWLGKTGGLDFAGRDGAALGASKIVLLLLIVGTTQIVAPGLLIGTAWAQSQCQKCVASGESIYPGRNNLEYCQKIGMCPAAAVPVPVPQAPAQSAPAQNPGAPIPAGMPPANGTMAVGDCVVVDHAAVRGIPGRIIALTPGGYVVQNEGKAPSEASNFARDRVHPGPCPSAAADLALKNQPHACFPSDPDAAGGGGIQQTVRAVIRQTWEHGPRPGQDGAVTVSFQSVKVSAGRRWDRPDGYNFSADQSKPVYDARIAFTTCTDYRASIMQVARTRAFQCFTSPTGDFNCQTSAMAGAADKTTTFQKY